MTIDDLSRKMNNNKKFWKGERQEEETGREYQEKKNGLEL